MAESTIVKTKRDGTITFLDNGGVNSYTVAYEAGDFSFDIPGPAVGNFLDRGRFPAGNPSIRLTDDAPMTGSFTAYLRDVSDATDVTLMEILAQSGAVSTTWVSTMGATGEVFTLSLRFTISGLVHGDPSDHILEFPHAVIRGSVSEGDPDTITVNWTSYKSFPVVT